jgi:hypothetical protein
MWAARSQRNSRARLTKSSWNWNTRRAGVGIEDELAVRESSIEIDAVLGGHHPVALAVQDEEYELARERQILRPRFCGIHCTALGEPQFEEWGRISEDIDGEECWRLPQTPTLTSVVPITFFESCSAVAQTAQADCVSAAASRCRSRSLQAFEI